MNVSPAKENILKRVRNALSQPVQLPFPQAEGNQSVFHTGHESLEMKFAEEFSRLQGRFVYCSNRDELKENLELLIQKKSWSKLYCTEESFKSLFRSDVLQEGGSELTDLPEADAAVTPCESLVARTGSILMSSGLSSGRRLAVFPPVHIVIAYSDQLVFDLRDALKLMKERYGDFLPSMLSFQTGPSRTADIEKKLVVGVHGPKEVYVFLLDRC